MINLFKSANLSNVVFTIVSITMCFLLFLFLKSNGFVAADVFDMQGNPDIVYSRDLMSAGSDDDGVVWPMMFFRVLFILITLLNLKKRRLIFFILPFVFDIICLCLISDTSSVGRTIAHNGVFLVWFLTWIVSFMACVIVLLKSAAPPVPYPAE